MHSYCVLVCSTFFLEVVHENKIKESQSGVHDRRRDATSGLRLTVTKKRLDVPTIQHCNHRRVDCPCQTMILTRNCKSTAMYTVFHKIGQRNCPRTLSIRRLFYHVAQFVGIVSISVTSSTLSIFWE